MMEDWDITHLKMLFIVQSEVPKQYERTEIYTKQYGVSDFKNLINIISSNRIPP